VGSGVGVLERIRRRDHARPLAGLLFYRLCYWIATAFFTLVYRVRYHGVENIPAPGTGGGGGGVLVVANHQSHLDPPLIGIAMKTRHVVPIARESLFRWAPLRWVLDGLGCIALRDNEGDAGALKAAIAALKAGRCVVIFPEGSRSYNGEMGEFKRGAWLLISRAGCSVLPVAVEGCFDAWPRTHPFPRLIGRRCAVNIGRAIPPEELKGMKADAGLAMLKTRVGELRAELRNG
jgi:1-acyl-sn-glycerol-3-phosphate acyltransferase